MSKMPELPEAMFTTVADRPLYTADQMRAMWLKGIAAARGCVPDERANYPWRLCDGNAEAIAHNACRATTLTNLDALAKEGV